MLFSTFILFCLSFITLVNGHGYVTNIKGANGKTENGFGVRAASIKPNNQGPTSVNGGADGGGPLTAEVDITGTGKSFKAITISKNFVDGGSNSANPITIQLAAGTACTGGSNKSTCLVRVKNPRGFGSCFAVASPRAAKNKASIN
ncbi:hypothetical protein FS842_008403 [Serendipita sp. 407]|nr:hypothetical protein FS842_008403 [Serendipita sp. 407]